MKKLIILLILTVNLAIANDKPNFSVVDTAGNKYTKDSTMGKFLVLNFWATWCPPCIKEIPELVDFYDEYKNQVQILGMDYEDIASDKVKTFTDSFLVNYPIIELKNQKKEFEKFDIKYLPTSYIYDKKGKLIKAYAGEITVGKLIKIMNLK